VIQAPLPEPSAKPYGVANAMVRRGGGRRLLGAQVCDHSPSRSGSGGSRGSCPTAGAVLLRRSRVHGRGDSVRALRLAWPAWPATGIRARRWWPARTSGRRFALASYRSGHSARARRSHSCSPAPSRSASEAAAAWILTEAVAHFLL